jgi:tellurite methyltransferase
MQREITGFLRDEVGDWVAELECHHRQHVRHRPPFLERAWVETAQGRSERVGTTFDCPLCDRAELPAGLVVARTAGPFDESTLPAGLQRNHRVAGGVWGMLRVLSGCAHFTMQTVAPISLDLRGGDSHPIPPGVFHAVALTAGSVEVDFLVPHSAVASD